MTDQPPYEYVPLSSEEVDRMTGMDVLRHEAETNPIAALAVKRLEAATEALQPELARLRDAWERELMDGPFPRSGLGLLSGD